MLVINPGSKKAESGRQEEEKTTAAATTITIALKYKPKPKNVFMAENKDG